MRRFAGAFFARFFHDRAVRKTIGYHRPTAFFTAAAGSRPGLQMRISELALLQQSSAGAVVRYREIQSQPGLDTTERWSTVVYDNMPDGRLLWRHLHETWVV